MSAPAPSPEQRAIRLRAARSSVLVAAAGSGKTRVLTWLFADAIREQGDRVEQLLTITFTDKAAGELRRRIADELGASIELDRAWIGTFHATCTRLLREFAHHRALDPGFGVIDELEAQELRLQAWERAVGALLDEHGSEGEELLAQMGDQPLRLALIGWWEARRSAGHLHPELPVRETTARELGRAASMLAAEVSALEGELEAIQAEKSNPLKSITTRLAQCVELSELAAEIRGLSVAGQSVEPGSAAGRRLGAIAIKLSGLSVRKGKPATPEPIESVNAARLLVVRLAQEHLAGPRVVLLAELAAGFSKAYADAKRSRDLLDFDDLELEALALLRETPDVRRRLIERFTRIFVDEFQDTNPRQAELVDLLAGGRPWSDAPDGRPAVTVVGDPRQAIYGFRYADVRLIEQAERGAPAGGALRLTTNYRTRAPILREIDTTFSQLDEAHEPVHAGRIEPVEQGAGGPLVELLLTIDDEETTWDDTPLGRGAGGIGGTKLAEARLIAERVAELRRQNPGGTIAVLARARAVLAPIAGALGDLGVDAQVDGADGFWQRLEVADLVHWLRLVRSRADDAALVAVCASPLVGLSVDGLALLGELREAGDGEDREARLLHEAQGPGLLSDDDAGRVLAMSALLERQRAAGREHDPAQLLDEVIEATAYDEHLLTMQDARRAIANVVRLRRLAAASAADGGRLADVVRRAQREAELELRAPEAAVAGPGAVRLMTVHQAKGLEFETVVVAGLGRKPRGGSPSIIADDSRLGLRLRTGPGQPLTSLFDHDDLAEERALREDAELRRVLYVALTRAEDRLIVSGVLPRSSKSGIKLLEVPERSAPVITWLAPALAPQIEPLMLGAAAQTGEPVDLGGVRLVVSTPEGGALPDEARAPRGGRRPVHVPDGPAPGFHASVVRPLPPPATISYTALSAHERCSLRFHVERVVGLRSGSVPEARPPKGFKAKVDGGGAAVGAAVHEGLERLQPSSTPEQRAAVLAAVTGGLDQDGRRWTPSRRDEVRALVEAGLEAEPVQRAHALPQVSVERPFLVALDGGRHLLNGVLDLFGFDPVTRRALVVDYKTDKFPPGEPLESQVAAKYELQRAAYALAAIEAGADQVEVVHVALRREDDAVASVVMAAGDGPALRARLESQATRLADPPEPTARPDRWVCDGCPARGTLCRVPLEQTWGWEASDQLTIGF